MDQTRTTLARAWSAMIKSLETLLRIHKIFDGSTELGKREEQFLEQRLENAKLELQKYSDQSPPVDSASPEERSL